MKLCGFNMQLTLWGHSIVRDQGAHCAQSKAGRDSEEDRVKAHICWFEEGEYVILDVFIRQERMSVKKWHKTWFCVNKNKLIILEITDMEITDSSFHHLYQNRAVSLCSSNFLFHITC